MPSIVFYNTAHEISHSTKKVYNIIYKIIIEQNPTAPRKYNYNIIIIIIIIEQNPTAPRKFNYNIIIIIIIL